MPKKRYEDEIEFGDPKDHKYKLKIVVQLSYDGDPPAVPPELLSRMAEEATQALSDKPGQE